MHAKLHPRAVRAVLAVGAMLGGLSLAASVDAQAEGNPYWIDHISVCRDPCPSMQFENCRCIKLDPVIVNAG